MVMPVSVVIPSGMLHGHSQCIPLETRVKTSLIDGVIILVRNMLQRLYSTTDASFSFALIAIGSDIRRLARRCCSICASL